MDQHYRRKSKLVVVPNTIRLVFELGFHTELIANYRSLGPML